jgi:hypothetical protein
VQPRHCGRLDDPRQVQPAVRLQQERDEVLDRMHEAFRQIERRVSYQALELVARGTRIGMRQEKCSSRRPFGLPASGRRRGRLSHRPRTTHGYRTWSPAEAGRSP